MCRVASIVLPSDVYSPRRARTWIGRQLAHWSIDDQGVTQLLVSELVTNAVRHARSTSTLTVAVATGMIEVGVTDHGRGRHLIPGPRGIGLPGATGPLREGGRGLLIVDALSEDWGVSGNGTGKQVWLRRQVPPEWPFDGTCSCEHGSPAAQPLPSGRSVIAVPGPWDDGP